ncbi:MAG: response regulator [Candidatus Woesearchaeota archaeon]
MSKLIRILHLEDEALIRRIMPKMLRGFCDEIEHAFNIAQAMDALNGAEMPYEFITNPGDCYSGLEGSKAYGALLLDMGLPDGRGSTIAHEARNRGYEGRIVMFSGVDFSDAIAQTSGLKNIAFLQKPADRKAVMNALACDVLYVDSDSNLATLTKHILENYGVNVNHIGSYEEAQGRFDKLTLPDDAGNTPMDKYNALLINLDTPGNVISLVRSTVECVYNGDILMVFSNEVQQRKAQEELMGLRVKNVAYLERGLLEDSLDKPTALLYALNIRHKMSDGM